MLGKIYVSFPFAPELVVPQGFLSGKKIKVRNRIILTVLDFYGADNRT